MNLPYYLQVEQFVSYRGLGQEVLISFELRWRKALR